jgi:hypothetical protein
MSPRWARNAGDLCSDREIRRVSALRQRVLGIGEHLPEPGSPGSFDAHGASVDAPRSARGCSFYGGDRRRVALVLRVFLLGDRPPRFRHSLQSFTVTLRLCHLGQTVALLRKPLVF